MNTKKLLVVVAAFAAFNANAGLTFSESAAGGYLGPLAFDLGAVGLSIQSTSETNKYLAPLTVGDAAGNGDPYSVITKGGSGTISFAGGVSSFSFLWGSPDNYNFLDIAANDASGLTYGGAQLGLLGGFSPNGDNDNTRLFTIGTDNGTLINSITFRSDGIAFEVAAAIPEPSTYALMIVGLAAVGVGMRRRKR